MRLVHGRPWAVTHAQRHFPRDPRAVGRVSCVVYCGPRWVIYRPRAVIRAQRVEVYAVFTVYVCCMSFLNVHVCTDLSRAARAQGRKPRAVIRVACVVLSTERCAKIEQGCTVYKKSVRGPWLSGQKSQADRRRKSVRGTRPTVAGDGCKVHVSDKYFTK